MIQFILLLAAGLAACQGLNNEYLPAKQGFTKAAPGQLTNSFHRYSDQASQLDNDSITVDDSYKTAALLAPKGKQVALQQTASGKYFQSRGDLTSSPPEILRDALFRSTYNKVSHDEGRDSPYSNQGNLRTYSPESDPSSSRYSAAVSDRRPQLYDLPLGPKSQYSGTPSSGQGQGFGVPVAPKIQYGTPEILQPERQFAHPAQYQPGLLEDSVELLPSYGAQDKAAATDKFPVSSTDTQFVSRSGASQQPTHPGDRVSQQPTPIKSSAPFGAFGQDQFGGSVIAQYNKPSSFQRQFLPNDREQFDVAPGTSQGSFGISSASQFPAQDVDRSQYGTVQDSQGGYKY